MKSFLNLNGDLMNVNISKYPKLTIHPMLVSAVQRVFAVAPNLTFVAVEASIRDNQQEHIVKFDVVDGYEKVGALGLQHKSYRAVNEKNPLVFSVFSKNIKKTRGDRYTITTQKETVAVKTLLSKCKKVAPEKTQHDFVDAAQREILRCVYRATSTVAEDLDEGVIAAMEYFRERHLGKDLEIPKEVMAIFSKEQVSSNIDIARAVKGFRNETAADRGAVVKVELDGSLLVAHLGETAVKRYKSTYNLPVYYQEKLAMLRMLDSDQPVEHVGMRFNPRGLDASYGADNLFFLVAGDTVVHS